MQFVAQNACLASQSLVVCNSICLTMAGIVLWLHTGSCAFAECQQFIHSHPGSLLTTQTKPCVCASVLYFKSGNVLKNPLFIIQALQGVFLMMRTSLKVRASADSCWQENAKFQIFLEIIKKEKLKA